MKPRAIGYLRVSTKGQADHGMGLDVQRDRVRHYAAEHGFELVAVVQEAASGAVKDGGLFSHEHRPILSNLIERAGREEYDVLLVASFDRLSRDYLSLLFLKRLLKSYGVTAVSATEESNGNGDAIGELIEQIIAAIHDFERKRILERLRAGRQARRQEGRLIAGFAPYGYRMVKRSRSTARTGAGAPDAGRLKPNEPAASVVRRIFREARRGLSPGKIAAGLNADNVAPPAATRGPTTKVGVWNRTTIRNIIESRVYRGELHGVKGAHEPIVTPALWNGANAALRARARQRDT